MTAPVETFVSLHGGDYTARFVDGRLDRLTFAAADDAELQDQRIVEVINAAQDRHTDDVLAAFDDEEATAEDRELAEHLEQALRRADQAVAQSPSLQRELERLQSAAPRRVGRSQSGEVGITLAGGRVVAVELPATLREGRQQAITAAVDEALADAAGRLWADVEKDIEDAVAQLTPQVLAEDTAEVLASFRRGRTQW